MNTHRDQPLFLYLAHTFPQVSGKDVRAAGYSGGHLDGIEGFLLRR
ncbi:MAG TPA: hypothetical protein VK933_10325 [Longimicrobiales bacterium]|nr:hypothetical protein [Longimicrobiales bacterium]